jgi:monovalent cation:proton antiporter-2 (CPA2) family protein
MTDNLFGQAFVYLLAAVAAVPVAKRLGLGSVLGYLGAGALIGPSALNWVGGQDDVLHFAEFGVVMMLFIIGLELRPALLWRLRGPILGLGGAQVTMTAGGILLLALLLGQTWQEGLACGLILAMSSTAIVLQSLAEKGVLKSRGGEACFSVLLFQDIAVIPILAVLPLLAVGSGQAADAHAAPGGLTWLPGWAQPIITLGTVVLVIVAGRLFLPIAFRYIARTKLREIFTASTLLLVIGIALLMGLVGLSPALGAFVAGVVLADSEYRHQLEADIEPFKGLLLGLFFITVGAGIDFALIGAQPALVASLTGGLILVKFALLLVLGLLFRMGWKASWLFAFALAQGGEFCFVLLSLAKTQGVLAPDVTKPLIASVALSMAAAPILLTINDKLVQPRFARLKTPREPDAIDEHDNPVILAGFGRFGHLVGRLLRANGFGVTVLDSDPDQVEMLGRFGLKAFYGDATRLDLLVAAGAERARLFICAIDDEAKTLEICGLVQKEFPGLQILARANSRQHAYELMAHGIDRVYRETVGTSLDLGEDALRFLGLQASDAQRVTRLFKEHDAASVRELAKYWGDEQRYVSIARQHIENLENVLRRDKERWVQPVAEHSEIAVPKTEESAEPKDGA